MKSRPLVIGILIFVALAILPLVMDNPYYLDLLILVFLWTSLSSSWNILGGYTGQVSMGHAAYFGIGAYTMAILGANFGVSPWMALFLGALSGLPLAFLIGFICFRLRGPYFVLATIALAEVLRLIALAWRSVTQGAVGLVVPSLFTEKAGSYYFILTVAALTILLTMRIANSKLGFYFAAIREDEDTAESIGINTALFKTISLLISAFFTALVGGFYAAHLGFIEPDIVLSMPISIQIAVTAITGGRGTVLGPALGSTLLILAGEAFRSQFKQAHLLIYGLLLIVVILFMPEGILGEIRRRIAGRGATPGTRTGTPGAAGPSGRVNPPGAPGALGPQAKEVR